MRVIETALDEDLSLFSGYLHQQRIVHRIFEERGKQVLEVADEAHADVVRTAYRAWQLGDLKVMSLAHGESTALERAFSAVVRYPAP